MRASRAVIERLVADGATVYGVTTGFGDLADTRVDPAQTSALQRNLVRSHAAGVGDPLPDDVVRAMLLLRANALAVGLSGVRVEVVDLLVAMLNAAIHPVVPSRGSLGASGDLAPLAHVALVLIGEGEATVDGAGPGGGAEALARAGLEPIELRGKGRPGAAQRDPADGRDRRPRSSRRHAAGADRRRRRRDEPGGDARHRRRLRGGADRRAPASGAGRIGQAPARAAGGQRDLGVPSRRYRAPGAGRVQPPMHAAGPRRRSRRAGRARARPRRGDQRRDRQPARLPVRER